MAIPALGSNELAKARSMRREGMTDKAIAKALGVTDRTLRRALGRRRDALRESPSTDSLVDGWDESRQWMSTWSARDVESRTGVTEDLAARVVAAGQRAHRRGDRWLEWFLRRWVERAEGADVPEPWVSLLAGLPVLAEWLSEPACEEIHELVLRYEPYVVEAELDEANRVIAAVTEPSAAQNQARDTVVDRYRRVRQGYASACRHRVAALRDHIESISYAGLIELPDGGDIPYSALIQIVDRLPLVEVDPMEEIFGRGDSGPDSSKTALWQLFAQVFVHEPPDERSST